MPSQALRRLQKLAGIQLPARHQTLGNFLSICLDPDHDDEDLIAAVELDPVILAAFLSFDRSPKTTRTWHRHIEAPFFSALGTAMAHEYLTEQPDEDEERGRLLNWRESILHSLLAARLADRLTRVDTDDARLAALLAGLGQSLDAVLNRERTRPIDQMVQRREADQAESTATLLNLWGCERGFCDAIRYHRVPLHQLADTTLLIKVVAAASHLTQFVEGPDLVDPQLVREVTKLLDIDEDALYEAIGEVSGHFDRILTDLHLSDAFARPSRAVQYPRLVEQESKSWCHFKHTVNEATFAAIFQNALMRAAREARPDRLIRDTGKFLFAMKSVMHLAASGDHLEGSVGDDEIMSIPCDSQQSTVAACYRQQKVVFIDQQETTSVLDRQLLERAGSDALMCLPIGKDAGTLVCGIDAGDRDAVARRRYLLNSYADAVADVWTTNRTTQNVNPQALHARLREIVHEANNPLSVVQNYLRTLSVRLGDNEAAQRDINTISSEVMRASEIIRKFTQLDLETNDAGAEVNVNDIIPKLIDLFVGGYDDIRFDTDLDPAMPEIMMPEDNFRQVMVNLLKNAVEALDADNRIVDRGKRITVTTCGLINLGGSKYIEVTVSDNGPGIPLEVNETLFQPRVSAKGDDHQGIGLSIARDLVEQMGGLITCKSRTDGVQAAGTTFQVLLPREQNDTNTSGKS